MSTVLTARVDLPYTLANGLDVTFRLIAWGDDPDVVPQLGSGTRIDLSGASCVAQAWNRSRLHQFFPFTVAIDALAGDVRLQASPEQVAGIYEPAVYDLLIVSSGGLKRYGAEGDLILNPDP